MRDAGVRYLFANLGSDHTGIVEAYAQARSDGGADALPELVLCPHEFVALSAAQGYAQVSGEAQAVLVHVDCGTQNLGGAVHNASRGRVPVLIFAGLSPVTRRASCPAAATSSSTGSRTRADQRGIVRGYVKYEHEIRTGRNVQQLVHRALQIARSEPAWPVYLVAGREVMEETAPAAAARRAAAVVVAGGPDGAGAAGGRRDRRRARRCRRPPGCHVLPGTGPGGGGRPDRAVRARGHRRDRVGADADELPGRSSAAPGLPVEQHHPESAARGGGRGARGRQRRAVDPGRQPPARPAPGSTCWTSTRSRSR